MDKDLRYIGIDAPVSLFVGGSERVARNPPAEAHMVELLLAGAQTRLEVAQTLPLRQLSEGHTKELVATREAPHTAITTVTRNASIKGIPRCEIHDLREHRATGMHGPLRGLRSEQDASGPRPSSNRKMCKGQLSLHQ
jgi:hypothetical protein